MPFCPNYRGKFQKILKSFILFISFISLSSAIMHDFHTSLAEMEYNQQSKTFEVALRVFTDDLENALKVNNNGAKVVVSNTTEADSHIARYISNNFQLLDKKKQAKAFKLIGKEIEGDVTWIYFELSGVDKLEGLNLVNKVLIESFSDQKNIVNINYKGNKNSFLLDTEKASTRLTN